MWGTPRGGSTDLATQWLRLITRSTSANLPGPGRQGHEGQQMSIVLEDSRLLSGVATCESPSTRWPDWPIQADERACKGPGKGQAEDLEAFLATSHPGQPVVDQRDAQAGELGRTGFGL